MSTTSDISRAARESNSGAHGTFTNITLWILQVLLAVAFLFFGGMKLAGTEEMLAAFEAIGTGPWFGYLTGVLEVGGAVALLVPAVASVGAVVLAAVMLGAVATHLFVIGGSFVMPLVLLALVVIVAWGRREWIPKV